MHRLKKGQEAFEVVDGPMAGRKFRPGEVYAEIPAQEKRRFEAVRPKPAARTKAAAPAAHVNTTTGGKEGDK